MAVLPAEINVVVSNELGDIAVVLIPLTNVTISAGTQGPQGIQGPAGPSGSTLEAIAGVDISIGTIVSLRDGSLFPTDPTSSADVLLMAGLAVTANTEGNLVQYVFVGECNSLSGLTPGPYWVGLNGSLSTTVEVEGAAWLRFMGIARSTTQFVSLPGSPVLLP